jgi:hypothetical protein
VGTTTRHALLSAPARIQMGSVGTAAQKVAHHVPGANQNQRLKLISFDAKLRTSAR